MGINFFDHLDEIFTKQVGQRETVYRKLISDMLTKAVNDGEISDTSGLEKNLESVLTLGLRRAKDRALTRVDGIDLTDFIDMDASSLNKAIDSLVDDFANKGGKRIAKKLKSAMLVADARGINIQSSDLKAIERDVSRVSGMTTDMIDDINNKLNELNVNKATEGIRKVIQNHTSEAIQDLQEMVDVARKKSEKLFNDTEDHLKRTSDKIREANKDALEAKKNQEKVDKANRDKVADEKRQSGALGYGAPKLKDTKEAMEAVNDVRQLTSAIISTFNEYSHIKDRFAYAIDSENNPLQKLLQSFEKGDVSLDEALAKVKQLGELNKLIDDTALPSKAMSGEGLSLFNTALKDVADGSMDAQGAFDKLMDSLRQGSTLIGDEGRATINAKSSLKELNQEYQRLSDVIESTKDSSGLFDKLINAEAQQSLERVSNFRRKLTHHLNEKGEWVPNKAEKTKAERDFSSPEWQQAITNLFNKSEETKQEVDKVTSGLDEMGQTGAGAGEKVAEGMKAAREEAQKALTTYEDVVNSLGNVANVIANMRRGDQGISGFPDAQSYNNLKSKYGPSNIKGVTVAPSEQTAQRNIKSAYDIFENALRKFDIGEGDEAYIKNVYANVKDIIEYNAKSLVKGETDFRKALEDSLPKRNKRVQAFIDTMVSNDELMNKIASQEDEAFERLYALGEGRTTEIKKPKLSVKLGNRPKEYQVQQIDTSQYLSSMQQELIPMLNPRSDQYDLYGALEKICGALGVEIPEASDKAVAAIKEHIETCEYDEEVVNRLGKTVDKYSGVLGKDYSNAKLTDIKGDLSKGWGQFKKFSDENKGLIPDPNTLNEEGVRAGYLYLNAFQEVLKRGSKDSKALGFRPLEMDAEIGGQIFGEAKDNKWLEEQINLYRQRLELIVQSNRADEEKPIIDTVAREIKSESDAHEENAENIQKEADAKKESEQHSPTPETTPQIKAEAEAHAENTENIQKEAEAKKESRTEDEKKSSVDDQMARYQQYIAELQKVRDEKKAIYDEEAAYLRELQIKSDEIFAQSQDTRKYDHYKESFDNAKLSNFDFIKDQPVSHVDALWQRFVDHGKRYLNTGDDAALGKAAGYYKQYADAVREAGEEVQRAKIGQNDLTDKLVSEAEALEKTKGITFDTKELNAVNIEIAKVRENVEKLEAEYDKAQKKLDKAESEMMAAQLSPAVQQQLQLREEADKTTAAVKKQKEAMQAPAESMDGAVESEQKLADAEEKVAEKAKEAADAKEQENAAGDNSKAVEQAKEEEAAIEKKTAARQRSLEVKKEEQKTEGGSKTSAQIEEEVSELNKLNAAYERRVQQQKEVQVSQAPVVIKAEDLSPVLMQLTNIIGLLERKNNLFIREGNIVTEEAARESSSLQGVANVLKEIVGDLQALNGKGVKLSFSGLSNLKQLTELDVDKLDERLIDAFDKIADFAKELGGLKVDDSSFVKSINDMLKHGEELKNLATALKASKKQIDNVTEAISKPKEQSKTKVDLSAWKELKSAVQEYYELKNTDSDKLTQSEQGRLTEIEGLWAKVRGEVEKTTAALKEQGQSTKLIEDVTRAYTTGFAEWQQQVANDEKNSIITAANKKAEQYQKNLNKYPTKYLEGVTDKLVELQGLLKSLEGKSIDLVKPEELQQVEQLTSDIEKMMASAEWRTANEKKIGSIANEINQYRHQWTGMGADFETQFANLEKAARNAKSQMDLDNVIRQFNDLKSNVRDAGKEVKSFWTRLGEQVQHTNDKLLGTYLSFQDIIRYTRKAAQAVIELDSALTELRKITGESTERMEQSFKASAVTAKELGSTIDAVISQTSDWSRLGYNVDEAEKLARVSTLFQTVGDNMTAESASKAMISTLKGFDMGVDTAESIVDRYTEVARMLAKLHSNM